MVLLWSNPSRCSSSNGLKRALRSLFFNFSQQFVDPRHSSRFTRFALPLHFKIRHVDLFKYISVVTSMYNNTFVLWYLYNYTNRLPKQALQYEPKGRRKT